MTRLLPPPAVVPMIAQDIPESAFVDHVIDVASRFGWLVHHDRPARTRDGRWRTAIQGHAGFPDLVLVPTATTQAVFDRQHAPDLATAVTLYRECKTNTGKNPDPLQRRWIVALTDAGHNAGVWRPRDYVRIVAQLTFGRWTVRRTPTKETQP